MYSGLPGSLALCETTSAVGSAVSTVFAIASGPSLSLVAGLQPSARDRV